MVLQMGAWNLVFWLLFLAWELTPALLVWCLRSRRLLSAPASIVALGLAIAGTGGAWYVGLTDSSSTAPAIVGIAPVYLTVAVVAVSLADAAVRAVQRRV
jgi:ABC-type enterochelin transport system permease subunit